MKQEEKNKVYALNEAVKEELKRLSVELEMCVKNINKLTEKAMEIIQ